jgi:hypothetical protein
MDGYRTSVLTQGAQCTPRRLLTESGISDPFRRAQVGLFQLHAIGPNEPSSARVSNNISTMEVSHTILVLIFGLTDSA